MKFQYLLIGTSLSLIPNLTSAQCVATQDCATLGYTETSCSGGSGIKCPFGNFWACLPTKESICKEEGFTLACNETDNSVVAILATDYINNVLAIRATNTLARVRATPEVPAPPVVASMRLVPAPLATNGKMVVVRNKFSTAPKVSCIIATVR